LGIGRIPSGTTGQRKLVKQEPKGAGASTTAAPLNFGNDEMIYIATVKDDAGTSQWLIRCERQANRRHLLSKLRSTVDVAEDEVTFEQATVAKLAAMIDWEGRDVAVLANAH
jgi:hypothetical protein